eukprot:1832947-Alexandrium_andersonii.AAC.1
MAPFAHRDGLVEVAPSCRAGRRRNTRLSAETHARGRWAASLGRANGAQGGSLSLIHISEPTRLALI